MSNQNPHKTCSFCDKRIVSIDYMDTRELGRFLTEEGKIVPQHRTGNCSDHQASLTIAIKRARALALL